MKTTALGRRIRELRRERGLTQDDLARLTGLKQSRVSVIESGRVSTFAMVARIARALGARLYMEIR